MPSEDEGDDVGDLAAALAGVARRLLSEDDPDALCRRMSILAVETIDGAQHCGVSVIVPGGEVRTLGASDDVSKAVDQIQYRTGQGPCLDAIREHEVFSTDDIRAEGDRWPDFSRRVGDETAIRSMLSFRLFDRDTLGALNLYADEVAAFTDDDRHVGAIFAAHAAVAMAGARTIGNLQRALQSRDVIATAKGMIMAQGDITADDAFDILRRASQRTNTKLSDIAARVVNREPLTDN